MKEKEERRWKKTGQREEGGGRKREEEERGRGRETQVARCGKKRRCGQRVCQEGRSERGHHEHIGKRGITEPYLPYLYLLDIMDVTARAGSGTSALCGMPGALYLLLADSKQNWPGQLGMERSLQNVT